MAEETHLDELQWKNPEFIQQLGLRTDNVLEYFSQSPFFDRASNNQVVKMQTQFNENFQQISSQEIEQQLKKMTGIEFVILYRREPDFWIIRKQNRVNPERADPIGDYYIIGANVYMAPNVKDVISNRLLSSALSLNQAFNKMQTLAQFTPSDGHTYKFQVNDPTSGTPASSSRSRTIGNTPYTPATPTVNSSSVGLPKSEQILTKATVDNLFNISLNSKPIYLEEEEPHQNPQEPTPSSLLADDELSIQALKRGGKPIKWETGYSN